MNPPPTQKLSIWSEFGTWLLFAGLCLVAGSAVGAFTGSSIDNWFTTIQLPSFQPPNAIFPIVWTLLYLLMGTAAWLMWRRYGFSGAKGALSLFALQFLMNLSWTPVFFGAQSIGGALVLILAILIAVAITTIAFWRKSVLAGALLIPYLAWVGFA
ncbi:MAG: TspO/MBR family protein, partial [Pseudomonadota bacterium]